MHHKKKKKKKKIIKLKKLRESTICRRWGCFSCLKYVFMYLNDNYLRLLWFYYVMSLAPERRSRRRTRAEFRFGPHRLRRRRWSADGATSLYLVLEHLRPLVYLLGEAVLRLKVSRLLNRLSWNTSTDLLKSGLQFQFSQNEGGIKFISACLMAVK